MEIHEYIQTLSDKEIKEKINHLKGDSTIRLSYDLDKKLEESYETNPNKMSERDIDVNILGFLMLKEKYKDSNSNDLKNSFRTI